MFQHNIFSLFESCWSGENIVWGGVSKQSSNLDLDPLYTLLDCCVVLFGEKRKECVAFATVDALSEAAWWVSVYWVVSLHNAEWGEFNKEQSDCFLAWSADRKNSASIKVAVSSPSCLTPAEPAMKGNICRLSWAQQRATLWNTFVFHSVVHSGSFFGTMSCVMFCHVATLNLPPPVLREHQVALRTMSRFILLIMEQLMRKIVKLLGGREREVFSFMKTSHSTILLPPQRRH